jgi:large subunit ribosomal protein L25
MAQMELSVERRERVGKNESRRLRRQGQIPAVLYGEKKDPVSLAVDASALQRILHGEKGMNTVFELSLAGTGRSRPAMVKEFQVCPITERLMHADFIRIVADQEVTIEVGIELAGTPEGVKNEGGVLEFAQRSISVRCLPGDIPASLRADVSGLHLDQVLHVSDLVLPAGVTAVTDVHATICSVHRPRVEAAPAAATVEGEAAAAAATPEAGADAKPKPAED